MYRRYSQVGDGSMSLSQRNRTRIQNVIILLLLAAVIGLLVFSIPMARGKNEARQLYIQQMIKECKDAYTDTSALSRTAGADSASTIARVRSNIHVMRTINNLNNAETGQRFVEDERFQSMLNEADRFLAVLSTGRATGESVTILQTELLEMQNILGSLE